MTGDKARAAAGGDPAADAADGARALWAGRLHGVLSTQSQAHPGYPFGSVVPYCLDHAGHALLLLSHLAQHRRNLDADPRCALTVCAGDDTADDVQQRPRLTVIAEAKPDQDPDHLARYCRYYPGGRIYAEQLNFALYRLEPLRAHYNGGFATARWLGRDRLLHARRLDAGTESTRLARLNAAAETSRNSAAAFEVVGIDDHGLDLRRDGHLVRLPAATVPGWPDPDAILGSAATAATAGPGGHLPKP